MLLNIAICEKIRDKEKIVTKNEGNLQTIDGVECDCSDVMGLQVDIVGIE